MNTSSSDGHPTPLEPDMIDPTSVAIVGMAGRFPGASNVAEFWHNVREGRETISFFTPEELTAAGVSSAEIDDPTYVPAKGLLNDAELFDANFFGYTPREAEMMDPQHRVFLESSWSALEDAGYDPSTLAGSIGVFAGSSTNSYLLSLLNGGGQDIARGLELVISSNNGFLTTRVSYKLDLKGPSIVVQTACSTSLVAVCEACQSLLDYRCDMALAGGVAVSAPRVSGYRYARGGISSPDGHCRPFDVEAQGTVAGEGVGIVVLKRLEEAIDDGDTIRAVIKGVAVNNDGAHKVGYTAPSVVGQAEVIAAAHAMADVDPATISLMEAHGTGTALGDPIEVAALTRAFALPPDSRASCALGSVKSNIGHLDAAAGVTGLIKVVQALQHREMPPSLHFTKPNPELLLEQSPFYVNATLRPWPSDDGPRRAGVSSFGIGGTNAHVVLEEAPSIPVSGTSRPLQVLTLSARSPSALETSTCNLASAFEQRSDLALPDVAYTLAMGRRHFGWRRFLVCDSTSEAAQSLADAETFRVTGSEQNTGERSLVFMFPGQGSQYPGMGHSIYAQERRYREVVDECAQYLEPTLALDLRELLFAACDDERARRSLSQTLVAQPALFVTEYALAMLLMDWGIRPSAMIGHSIGEYVAACLAGVMSLPDALTLVAARGRLMQQAPSGAMLAVSLPEDELAALLAPEFSLAAVNAPEQCVVAGDRADVERLAAELDGKGVMSRHLQTSHAFHSSLMAPILDDFAQVVSDIELNAPRLPYLSNVTGTWITSDQVTDPGYWVRHLRETVRFAAGVDCAITAGHETFVEVGPGTALRDLTRSNPRWEGRHLSIATIGRAEHGEQGLHGLLNAIGRLWCDGVGVRWEEFYAGEERRRVPLPTYPFEGQRFWLNPHSPGRSARVSLEKHDDIGDWFYIPVWKRIPLARRAAPVADCWLVFEDERGFGARVCTALLEQQLQVVRVVHGDGFRIRGPETIELDPANPEHFRRLMADLSERRRLPDMVIHAWGLDVDCTRASDALGDLTFFSVVEFVKAYTERAPSRPLRLNVIAEGAHDVLKGDRISAGTAAVDGLCAALPHEFPSISCRSIDLDDPDSGDFRGASLDALLLDLNLSGETPVAYRAGERWVQSFEPYRVSEARIEDLPLKESGHYLITGGLGKIGLTIAHELARSTRGRLTLVTRRPVPEHTHGQSSANTDSGNVSTTRALAAIEAAGGEVLVLQADVRDHKQLAVAIATSESRFGRLDGVVHAAGVTAGDSMSALSKLDRAHFEEQFDTKAGGAKGLARALDGRPLDFCVLMSSLSTVLGGRNFSAYASANAYLDAFASMQRQRTGTSWLAVDWDGWLFEQGETGWESPATRAAMTPEEGMEAFRRVLSLRDLPRVVVSTVDLAARKEQFEVARSALIEGMSQTDSAEPASVGGVSQRAALSGQLERTIASVWEKLFGIDGIGRDTDFFELGGHSLLAVNIASQLYSELGVEVSADMVLTNPTVSALAAALDENRPTNDSDGVAGLLEMVEGMSEEEVAAMLGNQEGGS